ncbi:MAG: hypothetical protein U5K00_00830 [Melioribacteraceae bacterium]|nr:hypothetical protein [Melioribacteraceae bacterium]
MKDLFPTGACRLCVVEVDGGRRIRHEQPCYPVSEGMNVDNKFTRSLVLRQTMVGLSG